MSDKMLIEAKYKTPSPWLHDDYLGKTFHNDNE